MTDYLTTRELAAFLRIKERKVYALASEGDIPCSRAMGKLLFPRKAVEGWLARNGHGFEIPVATSRPNVVLGGYDPLLDWSLQESDCCLATSFEDAPEAIARFTRGEGVAAGIHACDPRTGEWNVPTVIERLGEAPAALIEWGWRERGLILAEGRGEKILSLGCLRGRRLIPPPVNTTRRHLLDHLMKRAGLAPGDVELADPMRSEIDSANSILDGRADASFGLLSMAKQLRLDFVPLIRERFDLLVDRRAWFEPPMQKLWEFTRGDRFRQRVEALGGYNMSGLGRVRYNGL